MQRRWCQFEFVGRTIHPRELSQCFRNVPGRHHGKDPSSNKTFPSLVGAKRYKFAANEFTTTGHTTDVGHNIIGYNQENGKSKPKESIEDIVHDVFQLTDRQAQHHNCPAQLIQLEFDMTYLHGRNGHDKGSTVQEKGKNRDKMHVTLNFVIIRISLNNNIPNKISVCVKDCHRKPQPLSCPEERNSVLDRIEVCVVADFDQFSELRSVDRALA